MRDGNMVAREVIHSSTVEIGLEGSYEGWKPKYQAQTKAQVTASLEGSYEGWKLCSSNQNDLDKCNVV